MDEVQKAYKSASPPGHTRLGVVVPAEALLEVARGQGLHFLIGHGAGHWSVFTFSGSFFQPYFLSISAGVRTSWADSVCTT